MNLKITVLRSRVETMGNVSRTVRPGDIDASVSLASPTPPVTQTWMSAEILVFVRMAELVAIFMAATGSLCFDTLSCLTSDNCRQINNYRLIEK